MQAPSTSNNQVEADGSLIKNKVTFAFIKIYFVAISLKTLICFFFLSSNKTFFPFKKLHLIFSFFCFPKFWFETIKSFFLCLMLLLLKNVSKKFRFNPPEENGFGVSAKKSFLAFFGFFLIP